MLPKPEKLRKNNPSRQLDLVETIDVAKKSRRQRLTLIISLILTIGLSFIFWLFSNLKTFHFSPSLPKINFDFNRQIQPVDNLYNFSQIANFKSDQWSIRVSDLSDHHSLYSLNSPPLTAAELDSLIKILSSSTDPAFDGINSILPPGADLHIQHLSSGPYEINLLVNTPQKKFLLNLKIVNPQNTNLLKPFVPSMVETIYWSAINSD
jgi:hypothetical protein